ncbi:MAG: hypothetical protein JSV82_09585 [Planctomycetota bacterium]|nr:MAG: hypothetical protein JSV82_09585 [Planctomycetota bacterium]
MGTETSKWDMLTARQHLVDALWSLVEDHPVVAALVAHWTSEIFQHGIANKGRVLRETKSFARLLVRSGRSMCQLLGRACAEKDEPCDVLIVPLTGRSEMMAVSQMLVNAILEEDHDVRVGTVELGKSWLRQSTSRLNKRVVNYHLSLNNSFEWEYLRDADALLTLIGPRFEKDDFLADWFRQRWPEQRWEIARFLKKVEYVRGWLEKIECKVVITPNEQHASGSLFVTAAKMNGLMCHQILHGTPARLYWPFVSDETWVWGETSRQAFIEYGAPSDRLPIIGNLEITHWLRTVRDTDKTCAGTSKATVRNFLFLSQLHGTNLYDAEGFKQAFDWLAKVLSSQKTLWQLTVRLHPSDKKDARRFIRDKVGFLGERLQFSEGSSPLMEDARNADFACTCSSTAVLTPLVIGVPCALLWTKDMDRLYGRPFLDAKHVATNPQELNSIMSRKENRVSSELTVTTMLRNIKTADKVAARHVLECLCSLTH